MKVTHSKRIMTHSKRIMKKETTPSTEFDNTVYQVEFDNLYQVVDNDVYRISTENAGGMLETNLHVKSEYNRAECTEIRMEGLKVFFARNELERRVSVRAQQDIPTIDMYFQLRGNSRAKTCEGKDLGGFSTHQHNMFYSPSFDGQYLLEDKVVHNMSIQLTEKFYERLIDPHMRSMGQLVENMQKKQLAAITPYPLVITPSIKAVLYEIMHCDKKGYIKRLFLEAKILELFMLQAEQAEQDQKFIYTSLKRPDIEKVYAAKAFLEEHFFQDFTLLELSRQVGLNDFKLKKGFRELFGTTVFGYLNDLRMEQGKRMLLEKQTVAEVADILGYSQPHHFSTAFKRKFGYLPSRLKV